MDQNPYESPVVRAELVQRPGWAIVAWLAVLAAIPPVLVFSARDFQHDGGQLPFLAILYACLLVGLVAVVQVVRLLWRRFTS
jgi:hypothetical protein